MPAITQLWGLISEADEGCGVRLSLAHPHLPTSHLVQLAGLITAWFTLYRSIIHRTGLTSYHRVSGYYIHRCLKASIVLYG